MNPHPMQEASIPNPALRPLGVLIGNWTMTGSHPLIPNTTLHGRSRFEWLENGAFLMWRSEIDEPGVPSGLAIFGSDESAEQYFMLYFDERGVSRKLEATLHDNIWKMWRNAPGFSQRFTGTLVDGGRTIIGQWELSRDDATCQNDLQLTLERVE